jgi:hypothetical protein
MRIALRPSQRQHILEGGCDTWISPIDSPVEIGTVVHSKDHEKVQILSFNRVDHLLWSFALIFMAMATQIVRDAPTCGTLSCVVLRLDCRARNMVLLTTETGEAQAAKRGRRSEKVFEIPGHRPQKTVVLSMAIRVKEVSLQFSIFYLRQQTRMRG